MVPEKIDGIFREYIRYGSNRLLILRHYLSVCGVESSVISLNGTQNLLVNFSSSSFDRDSKMKMVVSHYDRVPGTPGANDNSAANFALAEFAIRLSKSGKKHNTHILFTDCEEIGVRDIKATGAFQVGNYFRSLGMNIENVFVFDACGKGEMTVLGKIGSIPKGDFLDDNFSKKVQSLYSISKKLLQTSCDRMIEVPVPMSDNTAFLACGIPSVCISTLPFMEGVEYLKGFSDRKLNLPPTWSKFHKPSDDIDNVDVSAFLVLEKILDAIADLRIPL